MAQSKLLAWYKIIQNTLPDVLSSPPRSPLKLNQVQTVTQSKIYEPDLKYQRGDDCFDFNIHMLMELCKKSWMLEQIYAKL